MEAGNKKELDPVKGMMQGKLKLKGDLPTIVKFIKAAQELVECSSRVPSSFWTKGRFRSLSFPRKWESRNLSKQEASNMDSCLRPGMTKNIIILI